LKDLLHPDHVTLDIGGSGLAGLLGFIDSNLVGESETNIKSKNSIC
jgi:hypothetical protein